MELLILIVVAFGAYLFLKDKPRSSSGSAQSSYRSPSGRTSSRAAVKDYKQKVIDEAIDYSLTISFRYTDQDGVITSRSVTPQYLERRHEGQILCLVAHCHLRNDTRTFVVAKMENIRLERNL